MLAKFTHNRKEWSSLDTCVFAYNTSQHESSHYTPFELMFGQRATLPIDVNLQQQDPEEVAAKFHQMVEPIPAQLIEERAIRLEKAKGNIIAA